METKGKIIAAILSVSILANVWGAYHLHTVKQDNQEEMYRLYQNSTIFEGHLSSAVSSMENVLVNRSKKPDIKVISSMHTLVFATAGLSYFFDYSAESALGVQSHLSTTLGLYEKDIYKFYSKAMKGELTDKDWEQLKITTEKLKEITIILDRDKLFQADKEELTKLLAQLKD
ncbi:hypothetical protein ACFO9Q_20615 [Paenibacillus sp. GCM10023252]|uniref:hypothetical protein n=1 Tax=Paenibacillus sp. GCM10023252 TaxID=3252649 RepID=UPI00361263A0